MTAHNVVHLPTADKMDEAKVSSRTLARYADTDRVHVMLRVYGIDGRARFRHFQGQGRHFGECVGEF